MAGQVTDLTCEATGGREQEGFLEEGDIHYAARQHWNHWTRRRLNGG